MDTKAMVSAGTTRFPKVHNRFMRRVRNHAARMAKEKAECTGIPLSRIRQVADNVDDEQVYAAARKVAVARGEVAEDADEETWFQWFKRIVLPVMIEIAKALVPIIIMILMGGS